MTRTSLSRSKVNLQGVGPIVAASRTACFETGGIYKHITNVENVGHESGVPVNLSVQLNLLVAEKKRQM